MSKNINDGIIRYLDNNFTDLKLSEDKLLSENAKYFFQNLGIYLIRDLDEGTFERIYSVIHQLCIDNLEDVLKYMPTSFLQMAKTISLRANNTETNNSLSKPANFSLRILFSILSKYKKSFDKDNIKIFLQILLVLPLGILISDKTKLHRKVIEIFAEFYKNHPDFYDQTLDLLKTLEPQTKLFGFVIVVSQQQHRKGVDDLNEIMLNYTKLCFNDKISVPKSILDNFGPVLKLSIANKLDFETHLKDLMIRMTLRAPEKALRVIKMLTDHLDYLDLSGSPAEEIAKTLIGQLTSKSDILRGETREALIALVKTISDTESLRRVFSEIIKLLNLSGSGKISHNETRLNIYQTIYEFSKSAQLVEYQCKEEFVEFAVNELMGLINKETVEAISINNLKCIESWINLLIDQLPKYFIDFIKTNYINSKKLTSAMKYHYLCCLNNCCTNQTKLAAIEPLIPALTYLVDNISKNQTVLNLNENVPLLDIFGRYYSQIKVVDKLNDPVLGSFVNVIGLKSHTESKLFNNQFLQNSTFASLKCLVSLCSTLISKYFNDLSSQQLSYYTKILLWTSLHDNFQEIRGFALDTTEKLLQTITPKQSLELVNKFMDLVSSEIDLSSNVKLVANWFWPQVNKIENLTDSINDLDALQPYAHRIYQFINRVLMKIKTGSSKPIERYCKTDRYLLLVKTLPIFSRRIFYHFYSQLYEDFIDVVCSDGIDEFELFQSTYKDQIVQHLFSFQSSDYQGLNDDKLGLVKCLTMNFGEEFKVYLIDTIIKKMTIESIVNANEFDVQVMNTREGYLANKDMLASLPKYDAKKNKNIKKENKTYSYKEQMLELELKKELEDKNQKTKKQSDNPLDQLFDQLSKTHQDLVQNQLKNESQIRNKMKSLAQQFQFNCELIIYLSKYHSDLLKQHFHKVVSAIDLLIRKSNLARVRSSILLLELGSIPRQDLVWVLRVIFLDDSTGKLTEKIQNNWQFNADYRKLKELVNPWMGDHSELEELTERIFEFFSSSKSVNADFNTFLCMLPAIIKFIDVFSDMEASNLTNNGYLHTTVSLDRIVVLLNWMNHQLRNLTKHQTQQLFETDLLRCLVKSIQCNSCPRLNSLLRDNIMLFIELFNSNGTLVLSQTTIFNSLVDCLICNNDEARDLALDCLSCLDQFESSAHEDNANFIDELTLILWLMRFDETITIQSKAVELWNQLELHNETCLLDKLMCRYLVSSHSKIMDNAVMAITQLLKDYPDQMNELLKKLFNQYCDLAKILPALYDDLGRIIRPQSQDQWMLRQGPAKCFNSIASTDLIVNEDNTVQYLFDQVLLPVALKDANEHVRMYLLSAGKQIVDKINESHLQYLLNRFESYMVDAEAHNTVKQCVVIFMGCLAKHLQPHDVRYNAIFSRLIDNLSCDSESVQVSVSDTIEPLIKSFDETKQKQIADNLLRVLLSSKDPVESRGAGYGIAGVVKAVGMTKFKSFELQQALLDALQDKSNEHKRMLALFTFEQISLKLGKKFEPFVPYLLKYLQEAFGDASNNVRKTADRTAKSMMTNLSGPAVKIILPPLMEGLESNQWRTKSISAEMLGNMAHCAPKQLSQCLPAIVPKILSVLTDSHANVVKSGKLALKEIGSVITNKEMIDIVPVIIDALCEPTKKTKEGLDILLNTKFIHQVDPASLALIMSLVTRSFKDRKSETRRKAAHIISNLDELTIDKDLEPYCGDVLGGLKAGLTDPDPVVREMSGRALGSLARVMHSKLYDELLAWLMETLKDEVSSVNRSGAAQGLSEVLLRKGEEHLHNAMPVILQNTTNKSLLPHVRDGYLTLFVYLPKLFGDKFLSYIPTVLPSIIQALSDEAEFIRETALTAAQTIIEKYSKLAIDLMLPDLEAGLLNESWRIRSSSIKLLGDLMFNLIGITGKGTTVGSGEDDNFGTSSNQDMLAVCFGDEKFKVVLSKIYLSRMDVSTAVRTQALHVWKLVVFNTVRTLRDILMSLMTSVTECLSSEYQDNKVMATKTLTDLVRKIGEKTIPEIFETLTSKFSDCDLNQRIGVCDAFAAILTACPKDEVVNYLDHVLPTFKICITNEDEDVRMRAVRIFDALYNALSGKILEIIIPDFVGQLNNPETENGILDALCTLVMMKGKIIMPHLIPKLTSPKVQTKALSYLARIPGENIGKHFINVLPCLFAAVADKIYDDDAQEQMDNCTEVILAMEEPHLILAVIRELQVNLNADNSDKQIICGLKVLSKYFEKLSQEGNDDEDEEDVSLQDNETIACHIPSIFRTVIKLFIKDNNREILLNAFDCFVSINKSLGSGNINFVKDIRDGFSIIIREQTQRMSTGPGSKPVSITIPALCLPERGIIPLIDVYKEALINGRSELKEVSACGFDECIDLTTKEILSKAAVKIAGPLIRTMSDRHSSGTRSAVVSALGKLVFKCCNNIKLFCAQIQAIFLKNISDSSGYLRYKCKIALARLLEVIPKPDAMFQELIAQELVDNNPYQLDGLEAVRMCLESAGHRLDVQSNLLSLKQQMQGKLAEKDDQLRILYASIVGSCISQIRTDEELILSELKSVVDNNNSVLYSHSLAVVLMNICKQMPGQYLMDNPKISSLVFQEIDKLCSSDRSFSSVMAFRALGFLMNQCVCYISSPNIVDKILEKGFNIMYKHMRTDPNLDVKLVIADTCTLIIYSDKSGEQLSRYVKMMSGTVIAGYRAKETPLRLRCERAILDMLRISPGFRKQLPSPADESSAKHKSIVIEETLFQLCCSLVEENSRNVFVEIYSRHRKQYFSSASHTNSVKEPSSTYPQLDNTYNKVPSSNDMY